MEAARAEFFMKHSSRMTIVENREPKKNEMRFGYIKYAKRTHRAGERWHRHLRPEDRPRCTFNFNTLSSAQMKLQVLEDERFSCRSCTQCCRSWHVVLMPGEAERIKNLPWAKDDPLTKIDVLLEHGGKVYTAHNKETGCVFLNLSNGRCRIHEQFGAEAKPLGCSVFPFQISPTFVGEAS